MGKNFKNLEKWSKLFLLYAKIYELKYKKLLYCFIVYYVLGVWIYLPHETHRRIVWNKHHYTHFQLGKWLGIYILHQMHHTWDLNLCLCDWKTSVLSTASLCWGMPEMFPLFLLFGLSLPYILSHWYPLIDILDSRLEHLFYTPASRLWRFLEIGFFFFRKKHCHVESSYSKAILSVVAGQAAWTSPGYLLEMEIPKPCTGLLNQKCCGWGPGAIYILTSPQDNSEVG